jgi:hypothetical protein
MRNLIFILLFSAIPNYLLCQELDFDLFAGYGIYHTGSLKEYQILMRDHIPLPNIEVVESFPGYINYSGSIRLKLNKKSSFGIDAAYFTTGGRNNVSDYSGQYSFDMILNGYRLGLNLQNIMLKEGNFEIYSQLKGGIILSSLKLQTILDIYVTDPYVETDRYKCTSFFGEFSLGARYIIIPDFAIDLSAGYQIDSDGKLHEKGNRDNYLLKGYEEYTYVNWSGFRFYFGLTYYLNFH